MPGVLCTSAIQNDADGVQCFLNVRASDVQVSDSADSRRQAAESHAKFQGALHEIRVAYPAVGDVEKDDVRFRLGRVEFDSFNLRQCAGQ